MGSWDRVWRGGVVLGCSALLAAGCGTRLTREEVLADNTVEIVGSGAAGAAGPGALADGSTGTGASAVGEAGPGEAAGGIESGPTAAAGGGLGQGTSANGATQSEATSAGGEGTTQARAASEPAPTKPPIIIGLVGYFSGIGGPVHIPKRDAWLVWEKAVNASGGINGHRVQVLVGDDGGSDSRALSLARDFVENKGAIALSTTGTTQGGVVAYANSKSVPVVGVAGGPNEEARKSPMMFQTSPGGDDAVWGQVAAARTAGVKKVAIIYCAESAECQHGSGLFVEEAKRQGLDVVAQMRASVTQPDFTAECIQARNAGAELILPITDNTAPIRIAQSCARQNYRPIFELLSASDSQAKIPELAGAVSSQGQFPWFLRTGSPGIEQYVRAFQTYAPNRLADGTSDQAAAWVAAKVVEKAAAKGVSEKPTSQDLLNGLWSLKDETLDGLMPGGLARTYPKGQPTPPSFCTRTAKLQDGKWTAPQGLTPICRQ
jgi:branched-chain amino acid transport system substrate-binding protein